jgi:beta-glucosidase
VPTTVTARPVQAGDRAADVYQRVAFDQGTTIDPQLTVATDDEALHGYISQGHSTPLPQGLDVHYSSNRPQVVAVRGDELRTVGSGIATVTATVTYQHHEVSTSFVVDVAPLQITSDPTASFTSGRAGSYTVTTATTQSPTADEVPALSVGDLPAGLSFTDHGDGTGTISGTPTTAGTTHVTVTARNAVSPTATQTLTITVG